MIEAVTANNLHEVLPLIRQYQEFYKIADISDERNRAFFSQFNESSQYGCLFAYRNDQGKVVAFATIYFSFVSSIPAKVGVMNDLYTMPQHRHEGIGKSLIEHCRQFAITKGAARLQWLTAEDNQQAQKLYDTLDTRKSKWLVYTYS